MADDESYDDASVFADVAELAVWDHSGLPEEERPSGGSLAHLVGRISFSAWWGDYFAANDAADDNPAFAEVYEARLRFHAPVLRVLDSGIAARIWRQHGTDPADRRRALGCEILEAHGVARDTWPA